MSGHTPGPWWVDAKTGPIVWAETSSGETSRDNGCRAVCVLTGKGPLRYASEKKANAHLIAAAPDALDALRELVEAVSEGQGYGGVRLRHAVDRARAAIAKAEGRKP